MSKLLFTLLLAASLSGCASLREQFCGNPIPTENTTINIDPKLVEPCKPLLTMDNQTPGFEDFQLLTANNALVYVDCKKKQEASIIFIKRIANGSK